MSERFFITLPVTTERVKLDGPEAHHLAHVMRAKVGDRVVLFDGSGCEFDAQIESIGKSAVELTVLERREVDREAKTRLTLAVALPKGDRQQWLVEKAVELGVASIVPLVTERGVARPVASALVRLRRFVVEASKQCGRNRLLEIEEPQTWSEFLAKPYENAVRFIAHPGGKPLAQLETQSATGEQCDLIAAIGAEGGFTDAEVQAGIAAGCTLVDLGTRILRVETAGIAIAVWALLGR
jgi:16S rRNA (uracil1498-N3)-methyltransferase